MGKKEVKTYKIRREKNNKKYNEREIQLKRQKNAMRLNLQNLVFQLI